MASEKRQSRASVEQELFQRAFCFNFFKAVHLLESFCRGNPPGKSLSPAQDPMRFRVQPDSAFPASDIFEIRLADNGRQPELVVNFMGLIGPKGMLPDWYNEHAQKQIHKKDYAFTDFLDLFHNRLVLLFYLAWKKYRLPENYRPDFKDPISKCMRHIIGIGGCEPDAEKEFLQFAQKRLIYFSGLVSRSIPTVARMETIVSHATGVAVRVEQFIERMLPIHEEDSSCLGRQNGIIGRNALCGSRVRDIHSFFRVVIGPMSWENYLAFQPGSRNLAMVKKLITCLAGIEYEFELHLVLRGPDIPALGLGNRTQEPILGRTVLLRRIDRPYESNIIIKTNGNGPSEN